MISELIPELRDALRSGRIEKLSKLQESCLRNLKNGVNALIAGQTGTGKTLAYLIPIVERLKAQETSGVERRVQRPRVVVLTPSRELARQVLGEVKKLGHHAKISSAAFVGGSDLSRDRRSLEGYPLDVVVATPGRLKQLYERGQVFFSELDYLVVDEADTMSDDLFTGELKPLLQAMRLDPPELSPRPNVVFVTASVTRALEQLASRVAPDHRLLRDDNLHRPTESVKQRFVDTRGRDKMDVLEEVLKQQPAWITKTMVFCNSMDSCRAVDHALREHGVHDCVAVHAGVPPQERASLWSRFSAGDARILVSTDLAARGLDTQMANHVVLFDFPTNTADYLHRAGRVGRQGQRGLVTSLLTKRDLVLARGIQRANSEKISLSGLTANRSQQERFWSEHRQKKPGTYSSEKSPRPARRPATRPTPNNSARQQILNSIRSRDHQANVHSSSETPCK